MRWLLDEGIPKRLAEWLRDRGDDVLVVAESEHRGEPDSALWRTAGLEQRVVITRDRGFLCPNVLPIPVGVVVVRAPEHWNAAAIALLVWDAPNALGGESLAGNVTVMRPGATRQSPISQIVRGGQPERRGP